MDWCNKFVTLLYYVIKYAYTYIHDLRYQITSFTSFKFYPKGEPMGFYLK